MRSQSAEARRTASSSCRSDAPRPTTSRSVRVRAAAQRRLLTAARLTLVARAAHGAGVASRAASLPAVALALPASLATVAAAAGSEPSTRPARLCSPLRRRRGRRRRPDRAVRPAGCAVRARGRAAPTEASEGGRAVACRRGCSAACGGCGAVRWRGCGARAEGASTWASTARQKSSMTLVQSVASRIVRGLAAAHAPPAHERRRREQTAHLAWPCPGVLGAIKRN